MNLGEILWTDPWQTGAGLAGIEVVAASAINADTDTVSLQWKCWARNTASADSYAWYEIITNTGSARWPNNSNLTHLYAPGGSGAITWLAATWSIAAPLRYPGEAASNVNVHAGVQNSSNWGSTAYASTYGTVTLPSRPFHAPYAPGVGIDHGYIYCSGNQTSLAADRAWETTYWTIEVDGVGTSLPSQGGAATSAAFSVANDKRYRGFVAAGNRSAGGPAGYSGYFYAPISAPGTPTTSRALNSTTVNVSWAAGANPVYARTYTLHRSLNGGEWIHVTSTTSTAHADTIPVGSTAVYRVIANSPSDANQAWSGWSGSSAASPSGQHWSTPVAPGVTLTRTGETTATGTVSGNQNSPAADKYWETVDWQSRANDGAWGGGGIGLPGTTTSFGLGGLPADSKIEIQVRSYNSEGGGSAWSSPAPIYTRPDAPSAFTAVRVSPGSTAVELAWTNNAAYPGSFAIERSLDGGTNWSVVATTMAGSSTVTVSQTLAQAALYRMQTVAVSGGLTSAYTASVEVGVAFISDRSKLKLGTDQVDLMYVGSERIRRVYAGTSVVWEDGDA